MQSASDHSQSFRSLPGHPLGESFHPVKEALIMKEDILSGVFHLRENPWQGDRGTAGQDISGCGGGPALGPLDSETLSCVPLQPD